MTTDSAPELSVVTPVLNESGLLPELHRRLTAALDATRLRWEVIVVDDGSTDDTPDVLRRFHAEDPRWKMIRLSRNFGHGGACTAGLRHARGAAVVVMDSDLQDPPELIGRLVEEWRKGGEVVFGRRTRRRESWLRQRSTALFYRVLNAVSDTPLPVDSGIFSLLDRRAVRALVSLPERHRYLTGLRGWVGFKQVPVEYDRAERVGTARQTLVRLVSLAFDAIFSFSNIPLRLATGAGVVLSLASFGLAAEIVYLKLFTNKPIIGWSSVMVTIAFIGGMILMTLGILGEYIGRIYDEIKRRPIFVISEKLGLS